MSPRGGGEPNGDVAKVDYYFNTFDNLKDHFPKLLVVLAMDGLFLTVRNSLL